MQFYSFVFSFSNVLQRKMWVTSVGKSRAVGGHKLPSSHVCSPAPEAQQLFADQLVSVGTLTFFSTRIRKWVQRQVHSQMHLSMDTLGIVDDSGHGIVDNYDMAKGAGSSNGGRVHSIDVILGFTKDQEPLLHSVGDDDSPKANGAIQQDPGKPAPSEPYGNLPELGDSSQHHAYHGESLRKRTTGPASAFCSPFGLLTLPSSLKVRGVSAHTRYSVKRTSSRNFYLYYFHCKRRCVSEQDFHLNTLFEKYSERLSPV